MNLNVGFTENAESFAAGLNKNKKDFDAKYSDVKLIPGKDGKDGFSPIVTVESIFGGHRVTITDASGTQVFDVMNGEDGSPGATGPAGADGAPGKDGANGKDGKDGYSPTVSITAITGGHRVTVTDKTGSKTFDVMDGSDGKDGEDGAPGKDGADGATGPAGADGAPGKDGANGKDGKDGYSPQKGIDYFTDADKAEMIQAIINALPVYNGEVVSA